MILSANEIHVGDVGTVITTTVKDGTTVVNVSAATVTFCFKKPTGVVVEKAATFVTDGSDGQVQYTTESGFLDTAGTWQMQLRIVDGTDTWKTDIIHFKVYKNVC
jgi:hypothetical protein